MVRYASLAFCAALACLACARVARAQIVAADPYSIPPYTLGSLAGQAVGGFGFTGDWSIGSTTQSLYVVGPGLIGRSNNDGANAGDIANFAGGGFTVASGQVYISYNIVNASLTPSNNSRLDAYSTLPTTRSRFSLILRRLATTRPVALPMPMPQPRGRHLHRRPFRATTW
jgi:hypothetical protein